MRSLNECLQNLTDLAIRSEEVARDTERIRDETAAALIVFVANSDKDERELARELVPRLYWEHPTFRVADIANAFPHTFSGANTVHRLAGDGSREATCNRCFEQFGYSKATRTDRVPSICASCYEVATKSHQEQLARRARERAALISAAARSGRLVKRVEPEAVMYEIEGDVSGLGYPFIFPEEVVGLVTPGTP